MPSKSRLHRQFECSVLAPGLSPESRCDVMWQVSGRRLWQEAPAAPAAPAAPVIVLGEVAPGAIRSLVLVYSLVAIYAIAVKILVQAFPISTAAANTLYVGLIAVPVYWAYTVYRRFMESLKFRASYLEASPVQAG